MSRSWTSVRGSRAAVPVLQLTPSERIVFGEDQLPAPTDADRLRDTEREILTAVNTAPPGSDEFVVVLCTTSGDENLWCIDPALDDEHASRVADRIVRTQIHLYRELLTRRAIAFFVVELAIRDAGLLREAGARLADELAPHDAGQGHVVGSDSWLVARYALYTSSHLEETLTHVLPQMANVLTRRSERARRQSREFSSTVPPKFG